MSDYTWTGNPWYDLRGRYYADARDAETSRRLQRERDALEAARKAAILQREEDEAVIRYGSLAPYCCTDPQDCTDDEPCDGCRAALRDAA